MGEDRRRRGTGTVERVGDRWRFKCPDGAGGRYVSRAIYETEAVAKLALAEYRASVASRELLPVGGMTLSEYVESLYAARIRQEHPASAKYYLSRFRTQIEPVLGATPLPALTRVAVVAWSRKLTGKSAKITVIVLRQILAAAVEDGVLTSNVALGVKVHREIDPDEDLAAKCPTPEELEQFIAAQATDVRYIVRFARGTGLRAGEWSNLELRDVHADGDEPHVFVRFGSKGRITKGKRRRVVALFGDTLVAVREWLRILPTWAPHNPHGLLFPRSTGFRRDSAPFGRVNLDNGRRGSAWRLLLEAAGIAKAFKPHGFRHATATGLLDGSLTGRKWTLYETQQQLGHAQGTTTEGYSHPSVRMLLDAGRESDAAFRSKQSPRATPARVETPAIAAVYGTSGADLTLNSSFHAPHADEPLRALLGPIDPSSWTDRGLIDDLRAAFAKMAAGDYDDRDGRLALAIRIEKELREQVPLLLAIARITSGSEHEAFAFVEIVRLLIPDARAMRAARP